MLDPSHLVFSERTIQPKRKVMAVEIFSVAVEAAIGPVFAQFDALVFHG